MNRALTRILPVMLALLAALVVSACSSEEHSEVPEGEPVELDGVRYNVVITRYLNPDLVDDAAYLGDHAEWPGTDKLLLGVFIQIANHSGETITVPEDLIVFDTQDRRYEPIAVDTDFALELGSELEHDKSLPEIDSPASFSPIQGSLVLYEIETSSVENRPLRLEIPGQGDSDHHVFIKLDI